LRGGLGEADVERVDRAEAVAPAMRPSLPWISEKNLSISPVHLVNRSVLAGLGELEDLAAAGRNVVGIGDA
jgi:hypothetical protein